MRRSSRIRAGAPTRSRRPRKISCRACSRPSSPGSLAGTSARGAAFELRLSGPVEGSRLTGVLLGAGDHRTRTEDRPAPPELAFGERVRLGPIAATVNDRAGRRVELVAELA